MNISYNSSGIDKTMENRKYNLKSMQKASQDYNKKKKELDSIGDRINYNLRKSIAISF